MSHDVSGWQPDWTSHTQALSATHRDRLLRLRGQPIDATWLVWIVDTDKWYADLPVVLRIGDVLAPRRHLAGTRPRPPADIQRPGRERID